MADQFKFVQNQPSSLAGAGVVVGNSTMILTSFTQIDGTLLTMTDFGAIGFGTVEPGNGTNEEQICFTGITQNSNGTATLTGVSSVAFVSPYTQTANFQKNHVGGTTFVVSNTAGFYDKMVSKNDDETITGIYTFTDPNVPRMDVDHTYGAGEEKYFATYKLVQDTSYAGTVNATTTAKGNSQLASDAQLQAGTETGSTGASVVAHGNNFTQTPTANKVPVANSSGKLPAGWGGAPSTLATLNASSLVVENPANASVTPTANYIPIANGSGLISSSWLDLLLRGTGSDGAVTLGAGTTTLTRDMYYTTLIVPNGATLKTNGYRVYATASVTIDAGGIVDFSGNNGTAGGNATAAAVGAAGAGGAALNSGTVFGSYIGGAGGAGANSGIGVAGVAGTSSSDVYGVAGTAGGAGGAAGVTAGGTAGAAGTKADAGSRLQDLVSLFQVSNARGGTVNQITPSTGCGGGGGGGSNAVNTYGGGGAGAPSGGGVIFFSTRVFTNNGTVSSNGGNGANGGSGYAAANAAGGGGASSGAPGGLIIILANSIPSYGTLNVNGGTGGTGGAAGAAGGTAGANGSSGSAGTVFAFII